MPDEGISEIPLEGFPDKCEILHVPWAIEAHADPKFLDLANAHPVRAVTQDHLGGIACQEQHAERDDAHAEDDDHGLQQAADDITHRRSGFHVAKRCNELRQGGMRPNGPPLPRGTRAPPDGNDPWPADSAN